MPSQIRRFKPNNIGAAAGLFGRGMSLLSLDPHIREKEARAEKARMLLTDDVVPELTFVSERDGVITGIVSAAAPDEDCTHLACFAMDRTESTVTAVALLERMQRALDGVDCTKVEGSHWVAGDASEFIYSSLGVAGFKIEMPDTRNMLMGMPMGELDPPVLAQGYESHTYRPGDEANWVVVKKDVFGSAEEVEFERYYSGRTDFDPREVVFVQHEGTYVAICAGIYNDVKVGAETGRRICLDYVGALESHRGNGLGKFICLHCLHHLKAKGAEYCTLVTQPYRGPAVSLYKRLGFEILADQIKYRWPADD